MLDVTPERIEVEWWHVSTTRKRDPDEHCAARFAIPFGEPRLVPA